MGRLVSIKDEYTLIEEETEIASGYLTDEVKHRLGFIKKPRMMEKMQEGPKMKMFDKPLKIFVSQPMTGRNYIDIYTERQRVIGMTLAYLKAQNIIPEDLNPDDIQIIDNYNKTQKTRDESSRKAFSRVYMLGDSIKLMADASFVIFVPGYEKAKGCLIERSICKLYDIPMIWIMDNEKETIVLENFPK